MLEAETVLADIGIPSEGRGETFSGTYELLRTEGGPSPAMVLESTDQIARGLTDLVSLLRGLVVPFLDRLSSRSGLISLYAEGRASATEGWFAVPGFVGPKAYAAVAIAAELDGRRDIAREALDGEMARLARRQQWAGARDLQQGVQTWLKTRGTSASSDET